MIALIDDLHAASEPRNQLPSKSANVKILACTMAMGAILLLMMLCCGPLLTAQSKPATAVDYHEVESLIQQHRFSEAKTALLDELKQHPSSIEGLNLLGIVETNQHDFPGATASLQKALQLNPRSTKTHNNLGNVYLVQQQNERAESEFRAVLTMSPANAEANYNLGVLLMLKGSAVSAIPHFERVRPPTTAARFNL